MTKHPFQLAVCACAILTLVACNSAQASLQTQGEAYIRAHISELSPENPTLGGQFTVTDVEWINDSTALVTYEDGHMQFRGRSDVSRGPNGVVIASDITLDASSSSSSSTMNDSSMSSVNDSSASMSSRASALEGEFCGGIAAFECATGLRCQLDGTYPDAGGTCVK